jgi:outer membrane protein assembly factor BamD (BamD/ComL family)
MHKLRTICFGILLTISLIPPASTASQNPEAQAAQAVSDSSDEGVLTTAAALMRRGQYGSESSGAALRGMATLLANHHDSAVAPLLAALLDGMRERDAAHNLMLAMFYLYKHGSKEGAESRLRLIVERYPKYSRLDEVLYQLSLLEYESDRRAAARQTLGRLISGYELSPRIREAQAKLKALKRGK